MTQIKTRTRREWPLGWLAALLASGAAWAGSQGVVSEAARADFRDYTLEVVSAHATPTPGVGSHTYAWGATVTCTVVDASPTYDPTGWTGSGSVPASGSALTTGELVLAEAAGSTASSITWTWALAPATVTTRALSDIQTDDAQGGGVVVSEGGSAVTLRGVCWNTAGSPTTADSLTNDGAGLGAFSSTLAGLTPDTTYVVRAYATTGAGPAYGAPRSFRTLAATPVAPTVSNPTLTSLAVARADGDGNPAGTEYAISIDPAVGGNSWVQPNGSLGAAVAWQTAAAWGTTTVTGLCSVTSYTFAAKARNGDGVETAPGPGASGAIPNRAPVAATGGPYTVSRGSGLTLAGSGSADPDAACGDSIVSYEWDIGDDGVWECSGVGPALPWSALSGLRVGLATALRLRVTDESGLSGTAATTITVTKVEPVISQGASVAVTMDEDGAPTPWSAPIVSATDAGGDELTWSKTSGPAHGTATVSGTGPSPTTFTYAPTGNWNGADSFVVQVADPYGGTDTITINVTVSPRNDPPVNTTPPTVSGSLKVGQALTLTPGTWDDAPDGNPPASITVTHQWRRATDATGTGAQDIAGATGRSYTLTVADAHQYVGAMEAATDSGTPAPGQVATAATDWGLVGKGDQEITFGTPWVKTYGDADFAAGATATSGLAVSYASSNPAVATVAGSDIHIVGSGTTTITASQAGDTNWNTAAPLPQDLTVSKAVLTIAADAKSRPYSQANPALTWTPSGFVNGDTVAVLTGVPLLACAATPASPVAGSPYPITIAQGSLAAANYSFTFAAGELTIGKATPLLTWVPPASIKYGAVLGEAQLNAAASTAGTFTYTPPAGTAPERGTLTLATAFVPDDPANWTDAAAERSIEVVDTTAPVIATRVPADGASGVALDAALLLTFSEPVFGGAGEVHLMNADGSTFESLAVAGRGSVTIDGSGVTLTHAPFVAGSAYYVLIDATCFVDVAGNAFAGIAAPSAWDFAARPWVVTFVDAAGGRLAGEKVQQVGHGASTAPVEAIPDFGLVFDRWSDSSADHGENPRTVRNVTADMELTVAYRAANPQPATGDFRALVDAAGRGLWDLTAAYTTSVGANPLTLHLVHDPRGRLTGTGVYTLTGAVPVEVPLVVRGSVKGRDGALTATLALRGVNAAAATSVSMALNLALNAATSQLSGPLTGSIKANGATEKVTETVMLNPSRPMDGAWTLIFDLHQSGRKVTGTAELTLSNQVKRTFVARGRTAGERVVLSLAGDPADPASRAIWIRTTITPLEGGWARLERLTGDAYGQTLGW